MMQSMYDDERRHEMTHHNMCASWITDAEGGFGACNCVADEDAAIGIVEHGKDADDKETIGGRIVGETSDAWFVRATVIWRNPTCAASYVFTIDKATGRNMGGRLVA